MSGKPAATLGSHHTCPMCSGTTPHVGGPIIKGEVNVLFNGKPVATMGSMCTCNGGPDTVITGNPSVLVNGKPIACLGDSTAHGGVIVTGEPNIMVGSSASKPTEAMPAEKIPFPKITTVDRIKSVVIGQGENLKEAREKQEEAKKHGYLIQIDFSV
ncbi:PAAR domain-containing protein [Tamlana agarivorans]|uniref:PAAR domain-containing protein n=1 Tax=Pseudotamlana agarivorans TaxID=481183 RepID=A0ACC5U8W9_9FLAO|nr:PAAR domain-containing protein [Tamlana agarivorans]MBU2950778.1 PAAR domain-containing protein [Tamlana agarivorans]